VTYNTDNYRQQGGGDWVIGGRLTATAGSSVTLDNLTVTTLTIATGGLIYDTDGKYDDLMFPAAAVRVPGSGGPGSSAVVGTIQTLAFDATSRESVHLQAQMPHRWKKGSALYPHVHWCTTATTGGRVAWGISDYSYCCWCSYYSA
jgi:hypothetical protein